MSGKAYLSANATLRWAHGHGGGDMEVGVLGPRARPIRPEDGEFCDNGQGEERRAQAQGVTLGLHSGCTWVRFDLQVIASLQPERSMLFAWNTVVGELGHDYPPLGRRSGVDLREYRTTLTRGPRRISR
jgi:hypothetical protein